MRPLNGCQAGNDPCPGEVCDEVDDLCLPSADVTILSFLGDDPSFDIDQDLFTIAGMQGEEVTVTLAAQNSNNLGRATLILVQAGGGLSITDHTALPNTISATLPATGTYLIVVAQQSADDLLPGNPFTGGYLLTVAADMGAAQTLTADPATVEGE